MDIAGLFRRLAAFCYTNEIHYLYASDIEPLLHGTPPLPRALDTCVCDSTTLEQARARVRNLPRIVEHRVRRGDLAILAIHGHEWIFRSSAVQGPTVYQVIGYPLPLAPDEVFLECAETVPAWRGKGVAPAMLGPTAQALWARGYRRCCMTISHTNASSCRAAEKGGARRIGIIFGRRRFGRWTAMLHREREIPAVRDTPGDKCASGSTR